MNEEIIDQPAGEGYYWVNMKSEEGWYIARVFRFQDNNLYFMLHGGTLINCLSYNEWIEIEKPKVACEY